MPKSFLSKETHTRNDPFRSGNKNNNKSSFLAIFFFFGDTVLKLEKLAQSFQSYIFSILAIRSDRP